MKKLVIASVLALAATAASAPQASAGGFDLKVGIGFSFGVKWNSCSSCYPGCGYGGSPYGDMVGPYYGPWGALPQGGYDYAGAAYAAPQAAPAWSAPAPTPAGGAQGGVSPSMYWYGAGYQPVGYTYPAAPAAPYYWYSR